MVNQTNQLSQTSSDKNVPDGTQDEWNPRPDRGTASIAHREPIGQPDGSEDDTIQMVEVEEDGETIMYPALPVQFEGKVRVYALNGAIKNHYEGVLSHAHEDDEWFEIHWDGTVINCEYMGSTRHKGIMKREQMNPQTAQEDMEEGLNSVPPFPTDEQDVPQKTFDSSDMNRWHGHKNETEITHDEGLYPTYQWESYDLLDMVDERPLRMEDTFVLLDQEPVNEKVISETFEDDIPDIREDMNDGQTVGRGARGDRFNL